MRKIIVVLCFLAVLVGNADLTLADAAPPPPPEGQNILPGEEITMVQMVAEEVIIDVGATFEVREMEEPFLYSTLVGYRLAFNCTFWMVNQGTETESMNVRFPIRSKWEVGKLEIVSIKVDGELVDWWEDEIDLDQDFNWVHFPVVFPPGEEVELEVVYTSLTYPNGYYHGVPHETLIYVLSTGAGWYGPIGYGKVIIRLPYQATAENVLLDYTEKEFKFTESDLYWEFTDLEPTSQDNLWIDVVSPDVWFDILAEREKLEGSPNNISSLHRLATAIYDVTVEKRGYTFIAGETLFNQGLKAIGKAARLAPNDIEIQLLYLGYLITSATEENIGLLEDEIEHIESLNVDLSADDEWRILDAGRKVMDRKSPKTSTPSNTDTPVSLPTSTPYITDEPIPPPPTETPEPPPTAVPPAKYPPFGNVPYRIILLWTAMGVGALLLIVFIVVLIRRRK